MARALEEQLDELKGRISTLELLLLTGVEVMSEVTSNKQVFREYRKFLSESLFSKDSLETLEISIEKYPVFSERVRSLGRRLG